MEGGGKKGDDSGKRVFQVGICKYTHPRKDDRDCDDRHEEEGGGGSASPRGEGGRLDGERRTGHGHPFSAGKDERKEQKLDFIQRVH